MTVTATSYTQVPVDKHVEAVRKQLQDRMIVGFRKYGVNTERTDLHISEWLQHLQDELMDAAVYVEVLKGKIK